MLREKFAHVTVIIVLVTVIIVLVTVIILAHATVIILKNMYFDLHHLTETKMSYIRHLIHGVSLGFWLFVCFIISFIDCIFTVKKMQNFVNNRIKIIYNDLIISWVQKQTFDKSKKEYLERLQEEFVTPFNKIRVTYELVVTSITSVIHSLFPQILAYHASNNLIKLYFNVKIMENSNEK